MGHVVITRSRVALCSSEAMQGALCEPDAAPGPEGMRGAQKSTAQTLMPDTLHRGTTQDYAQNNLTMRIEPASEIEASLENINLLGQGRADWCAGPPAWHAAVARVLPTIQSAHDHACTDCVSLHSL